MSAVTLQDILEDLNYLLGDTSVPSSGIDNQKRFINRINQEIYDYSDWLWATASTNYVFSGTTQTLPDNFSKLIEGREEISGTDNDNIYDIVSETDTDKGASDYAAWVSGNKVDGKTLHINQTDNPTLKVTYKEEAPTLSATSDTTKCPRSMVVARGAHVLMQEAEDPYRDTSDAMVKYRRELDNLLRLETRTNPPVKFFTKYQHSNKHFGEPR